MAWRRCRPGAELEGYPLPERRGDVRACVLRFSEVVMKDGELWEQSAVEYVPCSALDSAPHKILACIPYAVDAEEAGVYAELVAVALNKGCDAVERVEGMHLARGDEVVDGHLGRRHGDVDLLQHEASHPPAKRAHAVQQHARILLVHQQLG